MDMDLKKRVMCAILIYYSFHYCEEKMSDLGVVCKIRTCHREEEVAFVEL